ncbi:LptA [Taylorella asinigenitalis 14/45]|uniref:Lipopolysaccharide export system protein LptA n=1 Tax=Taylorella asinigenitalis 14/45 TaxID=1091495 RepID=I7JS71_9BURK|nr:lipopolysaccharide transport periplasmic protein LptA [Taylorella asinigenitalis]CCG20162.1 LptA [Taylorella asinigenitalis 14/45]
MNSRLLYFLLASIFSTSIVHAQGLKDLMNTGSSKGAEEPKTTVLSDSLQYNKNTNETVFSGNVILQRGLMKLTADELHITENSDGTQRGEAVVGPKKKVEFFNERPEQYELLKGSGKSAIYDGSSDQIILKGNAIITRSVCGNIVDSISGEEIIFDNANNTYTAKRSKSSRVRSVLEPRANGNKALEECKKKYNGKPMPSIIKDKV